MKLLIALLVGIAIGQALIRPVSPEYNRGFEDGKLYVRNAMLYSVDSALWCGKMGYLPDTISVKAELENGGSYKIDKEVRQ
jgi:hypothetical protein